MRIIECVGRKLGLRVPNLAERTMINGQTKTVSTQA